MGENNINLILGEERCLLTIDHPQALNNNLIPEGISTQASNRYFIMQRRGELLQSSPPKRKKPVLIHPHSPDYVHILSDPNLAPSALENLNDAVSASASFNLHQELPASFSSITELTVSCISHIRNSPQNVTEEAGRLITVDSSGVTQILIVKLNENPWSLGRNHRADLTIDKPTVSSWHCKLYALECDTGERIVCLEDLSTNGIRYNGRMVHKKAVILNEGDHVEIAGQDFSYTHSCPPGNWQGTTSTAACPTAFKPSNVDKYRITERVLGSGFFSVVHLAINTESGAQLACKMIKRHAGKQSILEAKKFQRVVQQEVKLNASLDHPNINKIVGLKQDNENIYLFLELVTGGDLFSYVNRKKTLGEEEAKFITYQLALALQYMHDTKQISHRDIKPENILLAHHGPDPRVLLADFGAARLADKAFWSMQGTMSYAAPEVLTVYTRPQGYDGKKADLWSLGVCVYTMICGFHPFDNARLENVENERREICKFLKYNIASTEVQFIKSVLRPACKDEVVKYVSGGTLKEVRDLLKRMFEFDPLGRISAREVLSHPWISQSRVSLEKKYEKRIIGQR